MLIALALALLAPQEPEERSPFKTRLFRQAAEMDYGPFLAVTVGAAKDDVVPKGIVIPLNAEKTANVLFDTELLRVAAVWTGGWLDLGGRAFADDSNDYSWVRGRVVLRTPRGPGWARDGSFDDPRPAPGDGPLPRDWARFRGLYRHGDRVVLSYVVGDVPVLESHVFKDGAFTRLLEVGPSTKPLERRFGGAVLKLPPAAERRLLADGPAAPEPLEPLTKGGPARWPERAVTKLVKAADDAPYVVDTLTVPEQNPWKSWMRFSGIDFFPDGRIAVCTWSGDVFVVSVEGDEVTWRRHASGIHQPMGLKIVDGAVCVSGRDQLTRLRDLNGDGEADAYECVNNELYLTTNFHEFAFDLQTDAAGDFYTAKGSAIWAGSLRMTPHSGTVVRIPKDGSPLEILCTGLRAPNGLAVGPGGLITVSDNQGNWVPACPINVVRKGAYYGFVGHEQQPKERELPLCWIPMTVDKSPGTQVWVPDGRWGPLQGRMLVCSYDCSISLVLMETLADGSRQGGVVRFPMNFPSGVMRGRFHPADGQLYLAGMRGWSSRAARDACLQRVRWTGKPAVLPVDVRTRKDGLDVTFSGALDAKSAADLENLSAAAFNVVRTKGYGSPEFKPSDPKKQGREPVEIASAALSADGKTLSLSIPGLRPVHSLVLRFRLKAADGSPAVSELDYTLHQVPGP
jgi:hypothetical protein